MFGVLLLVEGFFTTGAIRDLYGEFKITACGRCLTAFVRSRGRSRTFTLKTTRLTRFSVPQCVYPRGVMVDLQTSGAIDRMGRCVHGAAERQQRCELCKMHQKKKNNRKEGQFKCIQSYRGTGCQERQIYLNAVQMCAFMRVLAR